MFRGSFWRVGRRRGQRAGHDQNTDDDEERAHVPRAAILMICLEGSRSWRSLHEPVRNQGSAAEFGTRRLYSLSANSERPVRKRRMASEDVGKRVRQRAQHSETARYLYSSMRPLWLVTTPHEYVYATCLCIRASADTLLVLIINLFCLLSSQFCSANAEPPDTFFLAALSEWPP